MHTARQPGLPRFGMALVRGRSMEPGLRGGDRLLVQYDAPVQPGQVVLARFPDGTLAVKRVAEARATRTGAPGWWLLSDNAEKGVDSRHRGVIPADDVVAVVRLRIWPMPPWVRSAR
ncbi:MAG TPA: S24/S26 family peptidase [Nocardioides sp.]